MKTYVFDNETAFVEKLKELRAAGVRPRQIQTVSPYPVHGVPELLEQKSSEVRLFALAGAIFLPYAAVVLANAGRERVSTPDTVFDPRGITAGPETPARPETPAGPEEERDA